MRREAQRCVLFVCSLCAKKAQESCIPHLPSKAQRSERRRRLHHKVLRCERWKKAKNQSKQLNERLNLCSEHGLRVTSTFKLTSGCCCCSCSSESQGMGRCSICFMASSSCSGLCTCCDGEANTRRGESVHALIIHFILCELHGLQQLLSGLCTCCS